MKYGLIAPTLFFGASLFLSSALAAQEQEREVPKDSARVSIPGCAKGSAFTSDVAPEEERTGVVIEPRRRFRLSGNRQVLNEIKKREGTMVMITGLIRKNDLQGPGGISLAGGRVRIGGGPASPTGDVTRTPTTASNPVIDVEGFRPLAASCAK